MLITNQTNQDYWFGPLHLPAGINQTLSVDDTSATSLYLTDDTVADAINTLYASGPPAKITVSGQATPFPRATGVPTILHGDGSPDGIVYAGQGSLYLRRDAPAVVYQKNTGIHLNTGWALLGGGPGIPLTALPVSPVTSQLVVLTDSLTTPTYQWLCQYDSSITDANKWRVLGPVGIFHADSAHSYSYTGGGSYVDPTGSLTDCPRVTLANTGIYVIRAAIRGDDVSGGGSHDLTLGLAKNSTSAITGKVATSSTPGNNAYVCLYTEDQFTCAAGDIIGYLVSCGVNLINFTNASLTITPVRIS